MTVYNKVNSTSSIAILDHISADEEARNGKIVNDATRSGRYEKEATLDNSQGSRQSVEVPQVGKRTHLAADVSISPETRETAPNLANIDYLVSLRRDLCSWSCPLVDQWTRVFYWWKTSRQERFEEDKGNSISICDYCGVQFSSFDYELREIHLLSARLFGQCNQFDKFTADEFRQHIKLRHSGRIGEWTEVLEWKRRRSDLSYPEFAEEQTQLKNTQCPEEINQLNSLGMPSDESHEPSVGVEAGQQSPAYSTSGLWELRDVPGHYSSSFASSASTRSFHQMEPDSDPYAERPKRERLDRLPSLENFRDFDIATSSLHESDLSFEWEVGAQGECNSGDLNPDVEGMPNTAGPSFVRVGDESSRGPLPLTEAFHGPTPESLLEAEVQQSLADRSEQPEFGRYHMEPLDAPGSSSHRIDSGVSVQFTPSSKRAGSIQDEKEEQGLCANAEDLRSKVDTLWEAEILESCGISPELVQYQGPYLPIHGALGSTSHKVLSWLAAQQDHGKLDSPAWTFGTPQSFDPSLSGESLSSSNHVKVAKTSRIQAELDKTKRENELLKLRIKAFEDADRAAQRCAPSLDAKVHDEAVDFEAFLHFDVTAPEQGSQSRSAAGRSPSLRHSGKLSVPSFSVSRNRRSRSPSPGAGIRSRRPSISSTNSHDYRIDLPDLNRLYVTRNQQSSRVQKYPASFQCHLCPNKFHRSYNLRSHIRTHSDERPFVCNVCGKAFAQACDRNRHEGLHSGEKAEKGKAEAPQEVPHQSHNRSTHLPKSRSSKSSLKSTSDDSHESWKFSAVTGMPSPASNEAGATVVA
jgi:hypothetical protein